MSARHRALAAVTAAALAAAVLPGITASSAAEAGAAAPDPVFRKVPGFHPSGSKVRVRPSRYTAFTIDVARVRGLLQGTPRQGAARRFRTFSVPTPTGGTERFAVQRTTVMQGRLAARHPEIATYAGRSLDHPGTTVALDVTPLGFHASVRGQLGQRAWYVDPAYDRRGTVTHLSYYSGDVERTLRSFVEREAPSLDNGRRRARTALARSQGSRVKQRVYRLALASDPSYAAYFGSANVLAEKVTLINRVNQVYNDDLAINMRLVNAEDKLNLDTPAKATGANGPCGAHPCFDPKIGKTDPQLAYCSGATLGRNRTVLGQIVGASNYDVGHLALGVDGGGIAFLGVVGGDYKGGGCTGVPTPVGDLFAVDYVAHELGHQYGGDHTFNGVQYACSGGNRNAATSVEPGSGSSVMAYAGICLQDDLQPHSDPYFSQRSIDEISAYTGHRTNTVTEVQTVSLRGFDKAGETVTIGFPGKAPVTLTRGVDYDVAGIETAVQALTGQDVTIAPWGYDSYGDDTTYPAPIGAIDDTGFQVIYAPSADLDSGGSRTNEPSLTVSSTSPGVSGFVGETARGGPADNEGSTVVTTDNHAPTVQAPADRTLPLRTPFTLTGSGHDADRDRLTYLWEQNDIGGADSATVNGGTGLVDNSKRSGPLFRVFGTAADVSDEDTLKSPSPGENKAPTGASRTFPDLKQVLSGNTNARTGRCPAVPPPPADLADYVPVAPRVRDCYSEFLPVRGYVGTAGSSTPAMHFRLTARDRFSHGGGTGHDDVTLTLDQNAGPFLVTSQPSGTSLRGGGRATVSWAVNGTDRLAKRVRLLLSTDGGRTWSVLDGRTSNDGSDSVRLPTGPTGKARIMVEAVDNYFFAVNDAAFRIS